MQLATIRSYFGCWSFTMPDGKWWRLWFLIEFARQQSRESADAVYFSFHSCLALLSVLPPQGLSQAAQLAIPHSCGHAHSQLITGPLLYDCAVSRFTPQLLWGVGELSLGVPLIICSALTCYWGLLRWCMPPPISRVRYWLLIAYFLYT